jgi:hypothetical protein
VAAELAVSDPAWDVLALATVAPTAAPPASTPAASMAE